MQTIETIFKNSIRDYDNFENLENFIKETVFELSHKKLHRLKDERKIQQRVDELFEVFISTLKNINLYQSSYMQSVISGLITAINYEKERRIYELYYEKERIEKEIENEIKHIQHTSALTYETLENSNVKDEALTLALQDAKLSETQMLGILKEVTSEALITTIEKAQDVQETTKTIVENIVYQNTNKGDFTQKRILSIITSILDVAVELADANQAYAKDVLKGAVLGSRDGMLKVVEKFKNTLKFIPQDEQINEAELESLKKELIYMDEAFISSLKDYTLKKETVSSKIIQNILSCEIDTTTQRLLKASNDAKEVINEKLEELEKNASCKFEILKESAEELEKNAMQKMDELAHNPKTLQVKEDAKKLGERAWEVAKEIAKNAKEAINKK